MVEPTMHREPGSTPREPEVPVIHDPAEPDSPTVPDLPPPVPDPPEVVGVEY